MENFKKLNISSDLLIILAWVIFTIIFIVSPILNDSIIRSILAIPLVLFIPGYVLLSALFPKKDDLNDTERLALSFGLSIAVVPLIGLSLNFTRFGIRLIPTLVSLSIYIIFLIILGTFRRDNIVENERFSIPFKKIYFYTINKIKIPRNKIDRILTIVLVTSIFVAIGMTLYVITVPKIGEKFTEFYILNSSSQKADNYNTNLKMGRPVTYLMGVVNHEYVGINYTIEASIGGDILSSKNLTLVNNQKWEDKLTIIPDKRGNDMKLEFLLFKENNFTSPYRELHLWINTN